MRYERVRKDGTREVAIWSGGADAPVWLEGEPEWHFWLLAVTWFVALPIGLVLMLILT